MQGIFQGVLWIIIVYTLFSFIFTFDKTYIYFSLFITCISIFTLCISQILKEHVFNDRINHYITTHAIAPIAFVFFLLFMREFVNTKSLIPLWDKIIKVVIVLGILSAFVTVFIIKLINNIPFHTYFEFIFNGILILMLLIISIILIKKRNTLTRIFVGGAVILLLAIFVYLISNVN